MLCDSPWFSFARPEAGQGSGPAVPDDARMIDDFLEFSRSIGTVSGSEVGLAANVRAVEAEIGVNSASPAEAGVSSQRSKRICTRGCAGLLRF